MSCIEAHGKPRNNGYVRLTIKGKNWYAHRLAWTKAHGPIPEGMDICHKCDNRRCINVEHLFVGTRLDNMRDALEKGRVARGFMLPHTKLSEAEKAEITRLSKQGFLYKEIAKKFDVCRQHVGKIAIQNGVRRNVISK